MKHKWSGPDRSDLHSTKRECLNSCGVTKITRKEHPEYWTEFWREGVKVAVDKAPVCELIEVSA